MKYNDNGEYKDIYVKSFDTLPVGAEVDYDGEIIPNGWTEVESLDDKLVNVGNVINDNYKTNILLSDNLCNISLFGLFPNLSGTVESQSYDNAIIDTRNITSLYVSGDYSLLADGMLRAGKYNTYPVIGSTGTRLTINTSRVIDTSDANYVLLAFAPASGKTIEQIKNSFMVNKGSTAQSYQPYIAPTINVDGEDIYAKGQNEVYSTTEQRIGTWIDGKPIYRRVFNGTTASTAGQIATIGNIANLDTIIDIYGSIMSSGGYWANVPMYYVNPNTATTYYCVAQVDPSKNVYVLSSYTSTNVRVIVEYTKTID